MTDYRLTGPKGGAIVKRARLARVQRILPGLVKRFGRVSVTAAPTDPRELVVKWAHWGVTNEPLIRYAQARPMPLLPTLPLTTDCSGFATLCYFLAGCPDPNGAGYDGSGYTGTLLSNGKHVTKTQARPGDLVFFGPGTADHVCVLIETGADPLLVSHGQDAGPLEIRLSAEKAAHRSPVRYRSYLD